MLNIAKLSATVSSVASAAANTVTNVGSSATASFTGSALGRRQNAEVADGENILGQAKEKLNLHLKCTPSKDAFTSERLAARAGFMMQMNEQGQWQRRFLCLVPHTFLYYYDPENTDAPRGVIDMELFTNLSVEGNECNILKMGTFDDSILPPTYFMVDDPNELSEWMTSFHRDRFNIIRDEKEAYCQLQDHFTREINHSKSLMEANAVEKERLQQNLDRITQLFEDSMTSLRRVLLRFGLPESDMKKLDNSGKLADAIQQNIDKIYESHEVIIKELYQRQSDDQKQWEERLASLEKALSEERSLRQQQQNQLTHDIGELEQQLRERQSEVDVANLNTQIAITSKESAESKASTLSEQKKVLVKEVKQLRAKLDEATESNQVLQLNNEKLSHAVLLLQEQSAVSPSEVSESESCSTPLSPERTASSDAFGIDPKEFLSGIQDVIHDSTNHNQLHFHQYRRQSLEPVQSPSNSNNNNRVFVSEQDLANATDDIAMSKKPNSPQDRDGSSMDNNSNNPLTRYFHASPENNGKPSRRSSMEMLSSMFQKTNSIPVIEGDAPYYSNMNTNKTGHSPGATSGSTPGEIDFITYDGDQEEEEEDLVVKASQTKIRCLRCHGTIEGPKYSTCKCAIPAMTPEDLHTPQQPTGIMSLFKGTGGLFR